MPEGDFCFHLALTLVGIFGGLAILNFFLANKMIPAQLLRIRSGFEDYSYYETDYEDDKIRITNFNN